MKLGVRKEHIQDGRAVESNDDRCEAARTYLPPKSMRDLLGQVLVDVVPDLAWQRQQRIPRGHLSGVWKIVDAAILASQREEELSFEGSIVGKVRGQRSTDPLHKHTSGKVKVKVESN